MRRALIALVPIALLTGCGDAPDPLLAPGVPLALAQARAASISDLRYDVAFDLPAARAEAVTGRVTASFEWSPVLDNQALVLDFRAPREHVRAVLLDGEPVEFEQPEDHIVIPWSAAPAGPHRVTVEFTSTEAALNRHDEFLYALFVPDRASTAFPVFEQPDLKARFTLALSIPDGWTALSNGALAGEDTVLSPAGRRTVRFAETAPISTYLFSFAAGLLREEHAVRDGRTLTMFHRETDSAKVARNQDAIFDLHAASLRWLEAYTGIPYPFGKFAFFAVPSFQFGGMEHPGAIWYRADGLFLDPTATRNQELGRASLIAHETAHMWFGDLVTMRWFDDVWMKEVFANFMAAKIAGPSFPDIDLRLRFFQAHHPAAYAVDRTAGANPIRQPLENLREAGSLYGAIIYQKAPIVMKQLEEMVGEALLRDGLRLYLDRHRFGNATWPDLIAVLDSLSDEDLATWSRDWVEEPGRPTIGTLLQGSTLEATQVDAWPGLRYEATGERVTTGTTARSLQWPQAVTFAVGKGDQLTLVQGRMRGSAGELTLPPPLHEPDFVFAGADGVSYGRFVLDSASRDALLGRVTRLPFAVPRAVAWQALYEEMLDGRLAPRALLDTAIAALAVERDELLALQVLGLVRGTYWRFLAAGERAEVAPGLEAALWRELARAPTPGRKGAYFGALVGVTLTPDGLARLERIWRQEETPPGLPLTEQQYIGLAEALAIRAVADAEGILDGQERRITNPDRLERFRFMRAALSTDVARRRALFASFAKVENRRRESWVLDAMGAINHPLRAEAALPDLRAALELVDDIQRTGDIFFPLRWLNAALDGHQSTEAAETVRRFLRERPDLPPRLRDKVLQAADDLYRAARIVGP
jgi:aminopeptidase N